jgi:hypothetical protein
MNVSACGAAFIGGTTSTRSLKQQSWSCPLLLHCLWRFGEWPRLVPAMCAWVYLLPDIFSANSAAQVLISSEMHWPSTNFRNVSVVPSSSIFSHLTVFDFETATNWITGVLGSLQMTSVKTALHEHPDQFI